MMLTKTLVLALLDQGIMVEQIDMHLIIKVEDGDQTHYHSFGPNHWIGKNGRVIDDDSGVWVLQSQTDRHHPGHTGTYDSPDFLWPERSIDLNDPKALDHLSAALAERHVFVKFDYHPNEPKVRGDVQR